ncbi:hypothetical protein BJ170DRAFT_733102 [Xylariales sp. AK1849]|nr:hypothetical protein BJ170DRAFT_733102 [Xylariales sp. AK1849]
MDKLPPELASMIAVDLDFVSIAALRQTSRFSGRLFTPIFLQFLKNQKIDLSEAGLQRLYNLACSPLLNTAVSTLTLTCLHYHYDLCSHITHPSALQPPSIRDPQHPTGSAPCRCRIRRAWIRERRAEQKHSAGESLFSILSHSLKTLKNLRHINLEASVVCDVNKRQAPEAVPTLHWRELWTNAIHSYRLLLLSIASTGIRLDSLGIYQSTKQCSLPTHEVFESSLCSGIHKENFANFTAHLKSFSISLATTTLPVRPRPGIDSASGEPIHPNTYEQFDISRGCNLHADDHRVDSLAGLGDVARLLHMMPDLETLHIHLCTTVNGILSPTYYEELLAVLFSDSWRFPKLAHLVLRGLRTSQDDLCGVLSRHVSQLRTLSFENITLSSGSWAPVFSLLSRDAERLEKLRLSALWSPDSYGNRMNLAPVHRTLAVDDPCTQSDREEVDDGEAISWAAISTNDQKPRDFGENEWEDELISTTEMNAKLEHWEVRTCIQLVRGNCTTKHWTISSQSTIYVSVLFRFGCVVRLNFATERSQLKLNHHSPLVEIDYNDLIDVKTDSWTSPKIVSQSATCHDAWGANYTQLRIYGSN